MSDSADFFKYQKLIIPDTSMVQSHNVICKHINEYGKDYRYQTKQHPVDALSCRECDNTKVGLYPYAGELKGFRAFYRKETAQAVAGFSFDTIITGIDGILGTDGTNDGTIYDLSGRRLNKPVKGLNIIGKKKVLVK